MAVNITVKTTIRNNQLRLVVAEFIRKHLGDGNKNCHVYLPEISFDVLAPDESWVGKLKEKFPGALVKMAER